MHRPAAWVIGWSVALLLTCSASAPTGSNLLWHDEFNHPLSLSTDTAPGTWRTRGGEDGGPLAADHQDYAAKSWDLSAALHPEVFTTSKSQLTITASRDGSRWNGGALITDPRTVRFTYGYFEWRIRLPEHARGMFPALWLFGNPGNPKSKARAEIDMFEIFGFADGMHWVSTVHAGTVTKIDNIDDTSSWHRYGIDWTPTTITLYRDGLKIGQAGAATVAWFRGLSLGVRMDYAVDPTFAEPAQQSTPTDPPPGTVLHLNVDYVRVYRQMPTDLPLGP